jgi:hypothetical protein
LALRAADGILYPDRFLDGFFFGASSSSSLDSCSSSSSSSSLLTRFMASISRFISPVVYRRGLRRIDEAFGLVARRVRLLEFLLREELFHSSSSEEEEEGEGSWALDDWYSSEELIFGRGIALE